MLLKKLILMKKYMKIMEDTNHAATIYRQCEGCAFTCRKNGKKTAAGLKIENLKADEKWK